MFYFFFSSRRRHTRLQGDWSSDVCSSDLEGVQSSSARRTGNAPPGRSDSALRMLLQLGESEGKPGSESGGVRAELLGRSEERRGGEEGREGVWKRDVETKK